MQPRNSKEEFFTCTTAVFITIKPDPVAKNVYFTYPAHKSQSITSKQAASQNMHTNTRVH